MAAADTGSPSNVGVTEANAVEAFPTLDEAETRRSSGSVSSSSDSSAHDSGYYSKTYHRIRRGTKRLLGSDIPRGVWQMTAESVAQAPTLTEIRQGAYTTEGEERWKQFENVDTPPDLQMRRLETLNRKRKASTLSQTQPVTAVPIDLQKAQEEKPEILHDANSTKQDGPQEEVEEIDPVDSLTRIDTVTTQDLEHKESDVTNVATVYDLGLSESGRFPNGYKFPPKHTWKEAVAIGFQAFMKFTFGSLFGFIVVFYALNVVAWGGMIFLLLVGGGDAYMCFVQEPPNSGHWVKDCSGKHNNKSLWIEIDAQVLTALFCVTAFGLIPWRFRDLYHILQYRIGHNFLALRKLAAVHKSWFRLPDSHHLDPLLKVPSRIDSDAANLLPFPPEKGAEPPLTGVRAFPTSVWKMDFVVWLMFANTFFQVILCGFMWGMNRFNRPAWATALFIVLGMLSAMAAGILQMIEGKKIKKREGIPWKHVKQPEIDLEQNNESQPVRQIEKV